MPEPTLQAIALRYAARDLTAAEAAAFEARLTSDQDAREALAEAVRLSAAALGQRPLAAHASFLAAVREKLTGWTLPGLARRAYRGHPLVWAGLGAVAVAACTAIGLAIAERNSAPDRDAVDSAIQAPVEPEPRDLSGATLALAGDHDCDPALLAACGGDSASRSVAEIWANLSTPDQVEKLHDDELRWRDKLRGLGILPVERSDRREH